MDLKEVQKVDMVQVVAAAAWRREWERRVAGSDVEAGEESYTDGWSTMKSG